VGAAREGVEEGTGAGEEHEDGRARVDAGCKEVDGLIGVLWGSYMWAIGWRGEGGEAKERRDWFEWFGRRRGTRTALLAIFSIQQRPTRTKCAA
jgi:hypothetical protein